MDDTEVTQDDVRRLTEDVRALAHVLDDLRRERDADRDLLDELHLALASGARPKTGGRVYADWQTWVDEWLVVRISRSPQRFRWCHRYAEHPEVADRLEALWRAWEARWPDPESRLTWFRDGLDHHLAVIAAEDGALRSCSVSEGQHRVDENLLHDRGAGPR